MLGEGHSKTSDTELIVAYFWELNHPYVGMTHNNCSQVRQILERHLVVSDRAYTMADLKQLANDTVVLPTVRDHLKLRIKESDKSKLSATF
jgi:hypothetical protein